ncbi:MAG: hypothetical protein RLZZ283_22, partial [Candidatus Parcubacteria bacterium]|jgi:hypothetical protein
MMTEGKPEALDARMVTLRSSMEQVAWIPKLVPAYKRAFAGEPWFEVSKCASCDVYTRLEPGSACPQCKTKLIEAYSNQEVSEMLCTIFQNRRATLYVETDARGNVLVAAVSYPWNKGAMYEKKYRSKGRDSDELRRILKEKVPERFIWLDEIFADRALRASGNLRDFERIIRDTLRGKRSGVVVFRTISLQLKEKAKRVFPQTEIYDVPDPKVPPGVSSLVVIRIS